MNISFIAQVVFFTFYFIAWLAKELPQTTLVTVTAIAAIVAAVALVFDNRGVIVRHPAA